MGLEGVGLFKDAEEKRGGSRHRGQNRWKERRGTIGRDFTH